MKRTLLLTLALLFTLTLSAGAAVTYDKVTIKAPKSTARALDVKVGTTSNAYLTGSGVFTAVSAVLGGGYGATGVTIASTGNIQTNGTLTVDGLATLTGGLVTGTGFAGTGVTVTAAGAIQADTTLEVTGISTLTGAVTCTNGISTGTGFAGTGATISAAGDMETDGAITAGTTLKSNGNLWGRKQFAPTATTAGAFAPTSGVNSRTCFLMTYAGTTTITLPDPTGSYSGYEWEFVQTTANIMYIDCANKIVSDGVLTSDRVLFDTVGHMIGSKATCYCDGVKWYVFNTGGTTATVEAAD